MCILVSSTIIFSSIEKLKRLSNTSPCSYSPFHPLLCISYNFTTSSHGFSTSLLPFSRIKSLIGGSTTQLLLRRLMLTASRSSRNVSCPCSATYDTCVTTNPCSDSSPVATSSSHSSRKHVNCSCASIRTNARQTHTWSLRQTDGSACST